MDKLWRVTPGLWERAGLTWLNFLCEDDSGQHGGGGGIGEGSGNLLEAGSQPRLLVLDWGSGMRAVAAASTQPKGHLAPCPCSPHSWAHLPTDLKLRGGEKYLLFLESVGVWPGAGGLDAFSRW